MENPYTPPAADVADPAAPPARPVLVWIISLWYGFGAISSPFITFLMMGGALPLPAAERAHLMARGPLQWALVAVSATLTLWFAIELFRLRSRAVRLAAALLGLHAVTTLLNFAIGSFSAAATSTLAATAFAMGIAVAIYLYTRHLRTRGVLG